LNQVAMTVLSEKSPNYAGLEGKFTYLFELHPFTDIDKIIPLS
jgi:hypothetical protein